MDAALIVAIVAIFVSLLSAGWSAGWSIWHHRQTTTPKVFVDGRFGIIPWGDGVLDTFSISALNEGLVPVTLSSAFVTIEGASEWFAFFHFVLQSGGELPVVLGPGETWEGLVKADEMRRGVAEIGADVPPPWRYRVGVGGAGRRSFYSKTFELSPAATAS